MRFGMKLVRYRNIEGVGGISEQGRAKGELQARGLDLIGVYKERHGKSRKTKVRKRRN